VWVQRQFLLITTYRALPQKWRRAGKQRLAAPQCGKAWLSGELKNNYRGYASEPRRQSLLNKLELVPVRRALPHCGAASRQRHFHLLVGRLAQALLRQSRHQLIDKSAAISC